MTLYFDYKEGIRNSYFVGETIKYDSLSILFGENVECFESTLMLLIVG